LGEFLALAASLEHLAQTTSNAKAKLLAETLDKATGQYLENNKSPSSKIGDIDNRGSHFYLALYWAKALAEQEQDAELKSHFQPLASVLSDNEERIMNELAAVQGQAVDLNGYYMADNKVLTKVMQASPTFNAALTIVDEVV
jgi:isocitrate dehydrogenase